VRRGGFIRGIVFGASAWTLVQACVVVKSGWYVGFMMGRFVVFDRFEVIGKVREGVGFVILTEAGFWAVRPLLLA